MKAPIYKKEIVSDLSSVYVSKETLKQESEHDTIALIGAITCDFGCEPHKSSKENSVCFTDSFGIGYEITYEVGESTDYGCVIKNFDIARRSVYDTPFWLPTSEFNGYIKDTTFAIMYWEPDGKPFIDTASDVELASAQEHLEEEHDKYCEPYFLVAVSDELCDWELWDEEAGEYKSVTPKCLSDFVG